MKDSYRTLLPFDLAKQDRVLRGYLGKRSYVHWVLPVELHMEANPDRIVTFRDRRDIGRRDVGTCIGILKQMS